MPKDTRNLCYSARKKTGLSQALFGEMIGRSQNRISNWENDGTLIEEYPKLVLKRIRKECKPSQAKLLRYLLSQGNVMDALVLAMGGKLDGPLGEFAQAAERICSSAGVDPSPEDGSSLEPASSSPN